MTAQFIPYTIFLGYNLLTFAVFLYGPFQWPVEHGVALILFMLCNFIFYTMGYILGNFIRLGRSPNLSWVKQNMNLTLFLGTMTFIISIYVYTGKYPWDISRILNDQSQNYYDTLKYVDEHRTPLRTALVFFKIIVQPGVNLVLLLGTLNLKRLRLTSKILLATLYIFWALFSVFRGTDKEIFDILVILLVAIATNYFRHSSAKVSMRSMLRSGAILMASILMVGLFFSVFSQRKLERMNGNTQVCFQELGVCSKEQAGFLGAGYTYSIVASYASQGYHGLDLALGEDFETTYMLGGAPALIPTVNSLLGATFLEKTYVNKIDRKGWDNRIRWSTAYTWWASDISFFMVPLVLFLLAASTALSWREAIQARSDLAATVFSFMTTITIFLSANNQIAMTLDSLMSFITLTTLWLVTRQFTFKLKT